MKYSLSQSMVVPLKIPSIHRHPTFKCCMWDKNEYPGHVQPLSVTFLGRSWNLFKKAHPTVSWDAKVLRVSSEVKKTDAGLRIISFPTLRNITTALMRALYCRVPRPSVQAGYARPMRTCIIGFCVQAYDMSTPVQMRPCVVRLFHASHLQAQYRCELVVVDGGVQAYDGVMTDAYWSD